MAQTGKRVAAALSNDLMSILLGFGLAMTITPGSYLSSSYRVMLTAAPSHVWGVGIICVALYGYSALYKGHLRAWRMCLCLSCGLFTLLGAMFLGSGAVTGFSTYGALALTAFLRFVGVWEPGQIIILRDPR